LRVLSDVYSEARVDSQEGKVCSVNFSLVIVIIVLGINSKCAEKSRPRLIAGGFPVKLLGLTCGCGRLCKEGVAVKPLRKTILTT